MKSVSFQKDICNQRMAHVCLLLISSLTLAMAGCSNHFWRRQADKDTYHILQEKELDPRWANPRKALEPDPRSRFFDPYCPDHEALPPDDPAASLDMDCPNGLPGYKSWHKNGRAMAVENPVWLANFEFTKEMMDEKTGEYIAPLPKIEDLTILEAVELSYLHSREYQFELEQTFLAALALTLERFRFQVRYLGIGGGEPGVGLTYENVPGAQDSLRKNSSFGVSQLLPTGGQWAVQLANNTLWIFSGSSSGTNSASILSYQIVQPLLLNAGRKIALEGLTQAERDVLYAVRDLARFRKELFVDTVGGGYLGLLTQIQSIRNQEYNIQQLERQVIELRVNSGAPPGNLGVDLEALPVDALIPVDLAGKVRYDEERHELIWSGEMTAEQAELLLGVSQDAQYQAAARDLVQFMRGEVTPLDVIQLESRLASARIQLLTARRRFRDSLDSYKIQLGLPPDIEMTIDDSALEQFELIDPELDQIRAEIEESISLIGQLDDQNPDGEIIGASLVELERLYTEISQGGYQLVAQDMTKVTSREEKRLSEIGDETTRERTARTITRDRAQLEDANIKITALRRRLDRLRQDVELMSTEEEKVDAIRSITAFREELLLRAQGLQVIQIGLRSELIDINRYRLNLEDSVGLALENRLDLMNQRAMVMDARRNVEVIANRLKAVLDVVVAGDIRTEPGTSRPFDFSGTSSSHRVGVQFTAPLDQVAERNQYRAAQINYQRARRDYMAFEDNVKLSVRSSWRELEVLEKNLETARQSLRINVLQYDQAVEESNAPGGNASSGVRGRNLIDALNNILDSQNSLIQIWASYEQARLNIYRDMGLMEIDEQGLWIDPFYQQLYEEAARNSQPEFVPPQPIQGDADITLLPPGTFDHGDNLAGTNPDDLPFNEGDIELFQPSLPLPDSSTQEQKTALVPADRDQPGVNPLFDRDAGSQASGTGGESDRGGRSGGKERRAEPGVPLAPKSDRFNFLLVP